MALTAATPETFALIDDAVLDGEDLTTMELESALRWVSVYANLLRTAVRLRSTTQASNEGLRRQAEMYARRLELWKARAAAIADRYP